MSSLSNEILKLAQDIVRKELENEADKIQRALISATKQAMDDYYSFPEGVQYERTEKFYNSWKPYEKKYTRNIDDMSITVGVVFDCDYEYIPRGLSMDEIYDMNLRGFHGVDRWGTSPLHQVQKAADAISAFGAGNTN